MRHLGNPAGRLLSVLGAALLVSLAGANAALALDTCTRGEISASPLRPLPQPAVIGVDVTDNSPENAALATAFTNGMSDAGAKVPGRQPATVALRLSWQVLNPGGGGGGGQSDGAAAQPYQQGGIARAAPDIPSSGIISGRQSIEPGLLVFRAEARDPSGGTIYWIGSVQCTLVGSEDDKLLYELGRVIGGAIGQRRDHVGM